LIPRLGRETLGDFERASRLEWLETNGLGGYAAGSVVLAASRRYHGLLVAAVKPPTDRVVTVNAMDESVRTSLGSFALSSQQWPEAVDPRGFLQIDSFEALPRPTWRFRAGDLLLDRTLFMVAGRNTTVVEWRHVAGPPCELTLRPCIVMRDHHHLTHENAAFQTAASLSDGRVVVAPYASMPELVFAFSSGRFLEWPAWYKNFEYAFESERGLEFREDALTPGTFVAELVAGSRFVLALSTEASELPPAGSALLEWADSAWAARASSATSPTPRRRGLRGEARLPPSALDVLARAAGQFLVDGVRGPSVIAGYPWFTDWGRDSMIALPGLSRATGRLDHARGVLTTFAAALRDGLIPNRFVEGADDADYGSVDAALWFAQAGFDNYSSTKDDAFLRETLAPTLAATLDAFSAGTRFGIAQLPDGLLTCGTDDTALTWMDARIDDRPVTPRPGCPVEINALWYHAWRVRAAFARKLKRVQEAAHATACADRIREAFAARFWEPARGFLADRFDKLGADPALRPNQLYAIAFGVVDGDVARTSLEAVERSLLGPFGLRTLAPFDHRYRGTYLGAPAVRDAGYHNGTVWPFLSGVWADAHFAVRGRTPDTREQARRVLAPLVQHMVSDACLGQVSEIFDGDLPPSPRGALAQAWSVAELARVWIDEDL
jgi:predicted glycogen debranching enzyme